MGEEVRINLGAGETYIPGFVNIDIAPHAEVSLDLGKDKLPFEDNSVDLAFSYHTLEHVPDYLFAMGEIHRVLKHGAPFLVGVPYVTLTYYHLVNPYHLHNFNESSFDFFDPDLLRGSAVEQAVEDHAILFKKGFHRYHYMGMFNLMPPPLRGWCRQHLMNTVRKIDFGLVAVKDETQPLRVDPAALRAEYQRCIRSRVPYEKNRRTAKADGWRRYLNAAHAKWNGH